MPHHPVPAHHKKSRPSLQRRAACWAEGRQPQHPQALSEPLERILSRGQHSNAGLLLLVLVADACVFAESCFIWILLSVADFQLEGCYTAITAVVLSPVTGLQCQPRGASPSSRWTVPHRSTAVVLYLMVRHQVQRLLKHQHTVSTKSKLPIGRSNQGQSSAQCQYTDSTKRGVLPVTHTQKQGMVPTDPLSALTAHNLQLHLMSHSNHPRPVRGSQPPVRTENLPAAACCVKAACRCLLRESCCCWSIFSPWVGWGACTEPGM
jgi:hypothetical protein